MSRSGDWALELQQEQDSLRDFDYEYEQYEAEMQWLAENPFEEIYTAFGGRLRQLQSVLDADVTIFTNTVIFKMVYVHAVTLFEAMVGDVVKASVLTRPTFKGRLTSRIDELNKGRKYSLKEIFSHKDGADGIVMEILSTLTFHNAETAKRTVEIICDGVVNTKNFKAMRDVVESRHDFAHRNGKTVGDEFRGIDRAIVLDALGVIERFANDIYECISDAAKRDTFL